MAVLGLHFCARAFSSCGKRGPLFIALRGPLTIAASLVAEHKLQTRRLSSCGSRAQLLRGMWDLPRPGLEPASPALAGRFSTTAPPGKPCQSAFKCIYEPVSWELSHGTICTSASFSSTTRKIPRRTPSWLLASTRDPRLPIRELKDIRNRYHPSKMRVYELPQRESQVLTLLVALQGRLRE